jgi:hypothetical protein
MFLRRFWRAFLVLLLLSAVPARAQDCTADVLVSERQGLKLEVAYRCKSDRPIAFTADGERMARRVSEFVDGRGESPTPSNNAWTVEPTMGPSGGVVTARYRFDLTAYARSVDSTSSAVQRGNGALVLLSGWLLEPRGFGFNPTIDIRVQSQPGLTFAAGLPRVGEAWRLSGLNVRFAGYTAIGKMHYEEIAVPAPGSLRQGAARENGVLRLAILEGLSAYELGETIKWVKKTAGIQADFWQGFPARESLLGIVINPGRGGVGYGRSVPGGGATVMVEVGEQIIPRQLWSAWVLVHEWVHTGMPYIRGRATWFMEGAATYLEPIIRARAGWKDEWEVWNEWIDNMPKGSSAFLTGLPQAQGGGNYWGGATFMLLADIEIRKATNGISGLEDCFRGALWSGLDAAKRVDLPDYVAACDRATGTKVMADMVARYSARGQAVDLPKLWRDLGVAAKWGDMDDKAPLAEWRRLIVTGGKPMKTDRPWEK